VKIDLCSHMYVQPIALEVRFNFILQSECGWSLSNGTWQKRRRDTDNRFDNQNFWEWRNLCLHVFIKTSVVFHSQIDNLCLKSLLPRSVGKWPTTFRFDKCRFSTLKSFESGETTLPMQWASVLCPLGKPHPCHKSAQCNETTHNPTDTTLSSSAYCNTFTYMCIYIYIYIFTRISIYTYIYIFILLTKLYSLARTAYAHKYIYIYVHIYMYIYSYVYPYTYIYIYPTDTILSSSA